MNIETRWWDIFLLWISYHDGRLDVRIGAACLLILVMLAWNTGVALVNWYRGPQITG